MNETTMRTESVRNPNVRKSYGSCLALARNIETDGLHRPITVWSDGTLISGGRRLFAHLLLERPRIQAVFVNNVEDAAKRLLGDIQDESLAVPMKWSEVCRLWEVLRRLDEPAAVRRAEASRRRGVELRRQTQAGKRPAGRSRSRSEDYALGVICEPFGISSATAHRIETIYQTAFGTREAPDDKRELAREIMADIDGGGHVWPGYLRLLGERPAPVARPRPVVTAEPAATARQIAAWAKSLPQLEGLVAGLIELGPPNPELTWEQVGPVHTRLKLVRREIEKIINQMRETNKS